MTSFLLSNTQAFSCTQDYWEDEVGTIPQKNPKTSKTAAWKCLSVKWKVCP